jgi:uncharacterized protein (DUF433 family)
VGHDVSVPRLTTLDREMYRDTAAADLLGLPVSTLRWWLEGGRRDGRVYKPVLREVASGSHAVTWGEFVEAGLLKQYRRDHGVALAELRKVLEGLRQSLGVRYPLAHEQPLVGPGRHLMLEAQAAAGLETEMWLVVGVDNQLLLTPPSESFLRRVEWEHGRAARWRPHDDPKSPVRMDPDVRFGLPAVGGIRTEIVWEHLEAGEDFDEVAEQFEMTPAEVRWAFSYENSSREERSAAA